ncbi:hypothetical protein B0H15DRAFT_791204 [Mycena belliarum]|uniref:Uncharacterized protein n=1 Tax=Mycena belliarum TaxID=1033014 RepID=A0AAD6TV55_9AGAR|nr:hypothetical protein B0H15DRAFT_791204 [Mycena belliae]
MGPPTSYDIEKHQDSSQSRDQDSDFLAHASSKSCNINFSFLLTRYVGQTDGEAPERGWSYINPLATSTREMAPHLRREVLDMHFNDWNWKKILAMGKHFSQRLSDYVPAMVKTRRDTLEQERSLPPATVAEWTAACEAWEANEDAPNPFERTREDVSIASVRYQLTEAGGGVVRGDTSSSEMIAVGIQLEEQQRQLKFDQAATGLHPTLNQKRVMLERCSKLRRKILAWTDLQTLFMPELAVLRTAAIEERAAASRTKPIAGDLVQDIALLMPSQIEREVVCLRELQEFELALRQGQAHEALHELRHQLLVRTHAYKYKDEQIRGNRDTMRSITAIAGIDDQINRAVASYHAARGALMVLGPRLGDRTWEAVLKVLHVDDVRQMPERETRRTKKRKEPISWIWLADGAVSDADLNRAMNEAVRIEWAKTRALGLRNTEEVDLLEEEIRRAPVFLRWRADWWESKKTHTGVNRQDLVDNDRQREGHDAYATRQARVMRGIAARFEKTCAGSAALIREGRLVMAKFGSVQVRGIFSRTPNLNFGSGSAIC